MRKKGRFVGSQVVINKLFPTLLVTKPLNIRGCRRFIEAARREKSMVDEGKQKNQINLNPIKRLFENPQKSLEPYVGKGQVAADLGFNKGYYTFALADCVGPEGKVYAVDLKEDYVTALEGKVKDLGYRNVEVHGCSACDLSFIKEESVDFVLANGLLCNMPANRFLAVKEMKRILKPTAKAYVSLGSPPPFGFVGGDEWEKTLQGFIVEKRGGFFQKWAVVSKKNDGNSVSENDIQTNKRHRLARLRKKFGE